MVKSLTRCITALLIVALSGASSGIDSSAVSAPGRPADAVDQPGASIGPEARIQPLRAGFQFPRETLRYEAEYRYVTAGLATFRIEREGNQEHVTGNADSTGVVALLFRVQDRLNSYFDAQTLCSNKLVKHTEEGSHWRDTNITFDYRIRKAVLQEKNLKNGQTKQTENDIPACVTDIMSGILYVSSLPLAKDATYSIPLNDGGKTVTIRAHVEGTQEIKTPAGTFQTIRIGPEGDYSVLKNRGRITMWYSDDARHLPIQMQARMFWGTLTVYLAAIDK
jgi:hypothetical protein